MVVRKRTSKQWQMVIAVLAGTSAITTPVTLQGQNLPNLVVIWPVLQLSSLRVMVVTKIDEWEGLETELWSPMHASTSGKLVAGAGVRMKVIGRPRPLREVVALKAFGNLSQTSLQQLAKHWGVACPAGPSLYTLLSSLVESSLPKLGKDELRNILSRRLFPDKSWLTSLLASDEMDEATADDENQDVKEHLSTEKTKKDVQQTYAKHFAEHHGGVATGVASKVQRIKWPAGELSLDFARSLLPSSASASLQKDQYNNRWIAVSRVGGIRRSISRSWPLYGETKSLLLVARQCWEWHCRVHANDQCPHEEVLAAV